MQKIKYDVMLKVLMQNTLFSLFFKLHVPGLTKQNLYDTKKQINTL